MTRRRTSGIRNNAGFGPLQIRRAGGVGAVSSYWESGGLSFVKFVNQGGQLTFSVKVTRSADKNWALPFDAVDQQSHQEFQAELGKGWSQLEAALGCPGPQVNGPRPAESASAPTALTDPSDKASTEIGKTDALKTESHINDGGTSPSQGATSKKSLWLDGRFLVLVALWLITAIPVIRGEVKGIRRRRLEARRQLDARLHDAARDPNMSSSTDKWRQMTPEKHTQTC